MGVLFHTFIDHPTMAGALNAVSANGAASPTAALGARGAAGLLVSLGLWYVDKMPASFPQGEPIDGGGPRGAGGRNQAGEAKGARTRPRCRRSTRKGQIRLEILKEMAFLLPPIVGAAGWYLLTSRVPGLKESWASFVKNDWASGLLGSLFGGLIGGFVVWITRILGTLGFGRVAMGLGDVDLMFAVGTVLARGRPPWRSSSRRSSESSWRSIG